MSNIQQVSSPPTQEPARESHPLDARAVPPAVHYYPAPPRHGFGMSLVAGLLLAILVLMLIAVIGFFLLVASMTSWGGRTAGEAGQRVGAAVGSAAEALGRAGQEARDRLDPSHPPREALVYDTEIEDFLKLGVGQTLPGGRTRAFSLAAIKSREDGGGRAESSHYVVVHSELRQPNETKVLGLIVRRDAEPRDDYLYQGEAFRLGGQVYKVNWISPERQHVALIQLRAPDRANLPLKFVYD